MEATMKNPWLLMMLVILCCIVYVMIRIQEIPTKTMQIAHINYYRISESLNTSRHSLEMLQTIADLSKDQPALKLHKSTFNIANFLLFETLNNIDNNLAALVLPNNIQYIFGVRGSDRLASKSALVYTMRASLPTNVASNILPRSYIVGVKEDMLALFRDFNATNGYIMKKNMQQQKDIILTKDLNHIKSSLADYVIVQEILQNPFIVKGRKCNLRVYILIVVSRNNTVSMYFYDDGFMYYTSDDYKPSSINAREVITTGRDGRAMYKDRPLTHKDFAAFLGERRYAKLRSNIKGLCQHVLSAYQPILMEENKAVPGIKFLIYGMDVAPDANLDCKIMEINKGPDLTPKDTRDAELKKAMMLDALCTVGMVPGSNTNGFIKL